MDFSQTPNPYDFANPVSDIEVFAGREEELDEIKYYLDHAKMAARPINLALLGPRASGKTSLLNMTEIEAKKRNFCTVRIDLDEGDLKSEMQFFYKLFDSIFSSSIELGIFGGKNGKTFDMYLDIVNSYVIPENKEFCPCLFPLQYAKAMSTANYSATLSDYNFRSDLKKIYQECRRPIIILFDEGNILASSRIILEKLRNLFMNTPGYMLVMTGTPELFPVMDEVFSPIVRQFKKISISGFRTEEETELCVKKPLDKLGIKLHDIEDADDFSIEEIHELCSGRPYEIQLICHAMFRRLQSKRAAKMALDFAVIEDVRKELETSQDISARPIIQRARQLNEIQLEALSLLTAAEGHAELSETWKVQHVFPSGSSTLTKDELGNYLDYLVEVGILRIENDIIIFAGDDFDRIYVKYFAREMGVLLNIISVPLRILWQLQLDAKVLRHHGAILSGWRKSEAGFDLPAFLESIHFDESQDVFVSAPSGVIGVYDMMVKYRGADSIDVLTIHLTCDDIAVACACYSADPGDSDWLRKITTSLEEVRERLREVDGSLEIDQHSIPVIKLDDLVEQVMRTNNQRARELIATKHLNDMLQAYQEIKIEEALFHANMADAYSFTGNPSPLINLGYVLMAGNQKEKARKYWLKVIGTELNPFEAALARYDLAVLEIIEGQIDTALEKLTKCIELASTLTPEEQECFCLFRPILLEGQMTFEEIRNDPNLLETAVEVKRQLEAHTLL